MAARKAARKREDRWVEDPELGTLLELEPIEVEGSVSRANAIELDPIDIVGSRSADVEPFDGGVRMPDGSESAPRVRRESGVSTMLPEWVPPWLTEATGQPVRGMGGTVDYEVPEWAAELVADSEGQMPESFSEAALGMGANASPYAIYRQFAGTTPSREDRTISPSAALAGAARSGSVPLTAAARLAGYDNPAAALEELGILDAGSGEEWTREMETTARQSPGSFSTGEMLGTLPMIAIPGASAGRGATTAGRAGLAALEGAVYGGMEGLARSDEDTLGGQAQDAAQDAALGALFSGSLGGLTGEAARRSQLPVDEAAASRAMSDANLEWASHAGAAQSRKRMRELLGGTAEQQIENADFVGSRMRDLGITEPRGPRGMLPPTREQMGARFKAARERAQTGLESTHAAMEDRGPIELDTMLDPLRDRAAQLQRTPGGRSAGRSLGTRVREFDQDYGQPVTDEAGAITGYVSPEAPFSELQRVKSQLFTPTGIDMNVEGERQRVYAAVRDRMQQAVDEADPAMGAAYRENRRTSEAGRRMARLQADKDLQEAVNRRTSPSDYAMMAMGIGGGALPALAQDAATAGSVGIPMVVGAMATGALNRAYRANEHGLSAMRLERTARRLQQAPQRFGAWAQRLQAAQQRGPQAFAAALYIAAQDDAAVRAAMAEEEDVQQMRDEGQQQRQEGEAFDEFLRTQAEEDAEFQRFLEGQTP